MEIPKKRVAVIGLDGATWTFLDYMMNIGAMPETKNLLKKAAKGVLESYPPYTPPAWASIATGVNPGKHGIFGFMHIDSWSGEQKLVSTQNLEHPRIYEMIAMQGLESLVFNPIPSYPIIPLENLKIASIFLSPQPVAYPEEMIDYARSFPDYTEGEDASVSGGDVESYLNLKLNRTHDRVAVVIKALTQQSWDFSWIRLQDPDDLFHFAYNEAYSDHPTVFKIFRKIDYLIGIIRNLVDLLVLVSDHGFKKFRREININTILYKHGFAKMANVRGLKSFNELRKQKEKTLTKSTNVPHFVTHLLSQQPMSPIVKVMRPITKILIIIAKFLTGKEYLIDFPRVDPLTSRAYLSGDYTFGIVVRNNYDIKVIKNILMQYEGIKDVKVREKVFWGPYISRAPQLMIYPEYEKGYVIRGTRIHSDTYTSSRKIFDHDIYGICCFIGEDITPIDLKLIQPWDITPTIMAYMKIHVPHDSDGKILSHIFQNSLHKICQYDYTLEWRTVRARAKRVTSEQPL